MLLGVLFLMGFMTTCKGNRLPPISQGNSGKDTLDVAIIYDPLSYYIYSDTLGGINYDLLRRFENETKTPLKFWPVINLENTFEKLDDGTFDLLASLPSDYSLKKRFLTTESIYLDRLVLIQLRDSLGKTKINSALDLAGESVYVVEGSPAVTRLRNLSKEIGDTIGILWEEDLSEEYLCMKVGAKEIPFAIVNEKTAKSMLKDYPDLSYDNPVSFTQFQVWLMPKADSTVYNKINRWFLDFKQKPSYREIIDKY